MSTVCTVVYAPRAPPIPRFPAPGLKGALSMLQRIVSPFSPSQKHYLTIEPMELCFVKWNPRGRALSFFCGFFSAPDHARTVGNFVRWLYQRRNGAAAGGFYPLVTA
jgi:hypothetical protein